MVPIQISKKIIQQRRVPDQAEQTLTGGTGHLQIENSICDPLLLLLHRISLSTSSRYEFFLL